jgi:mono/diheme cytochrome c family protein
MRIAFKILLFLIVLVVIIAVAGVTFLYVRYPNIRPAEDVKVQAPIKPETRGAGGEPFVGEPESGFEVYSKNITPEGIGQWSDGQLIRAMTTGVNAHGEPLFPIMPYPRYARLAREDVEAIVAYIRALKPIKSTVPERKLPFPLPLIVRTMPQEASFRPIPPRSDKVAYGEYMTNAAVCADCHTPIDDRGTPLPGREWSGGTAMPMPGGGIVRPANITPDADSGIGTWTEQQFIDKFKGWRGVEARALTPQEQRENTFMPWLFYAGMTDEDLSAIYAYLRTVKPVLNRVKKHN